MVIEDIEPGEEQSTSRFRGHFPSQLWEAGFVPVFTNYLHHKNHHRLCRTSTAESNV